MVEKFLPDTPEKEQGWPGVHSPVTRFSFESRLFIWRLKNLVSRYERPYAAFCDHLDNPQEQAAHRRIDLIANSPLLVERVHITSFCDNQP